jgi:ABC-type antimicrobial peptide transport system permease subunit
VEALSLSLVAAVLAYGLGVLVSYGLNVYFLQLDTVVLFDPTLIAGVGLIMAFIMSIAVTLYKTDTMPLRELLSYE